MVAPSAPAPAPARHASRGMRRDRVQRNWSRGAHVCVCTSAPVALSLKGTAATGASALGGARAIQNYNDPPGDRVGRRCHSQLAARQWQTRRILRHPHPEFQLDLPTPPAAAVTAPQRPQHQCRLRPAHPQQARGGNSNSEGLLPPAAAGGGTGLAPACRTELPHVSGESAQLFESMGGCHCHAFLLLAHHSFCKPQSRRPPVCAQANGGALGARPDGDGAALVLVPADKNPVCQQLILVARAKASSPSCGRFIINRVVNLLGELGGAEGASSAALRCHRPARCLPRGHAHPVATVGLWRLRMRASTSGSAQ